MTQKDRPAFDRVHTREKAALPFALAEDETRVPCEPAQNIL